MFSRLVRRASEVCRNPLVYPPSTRQDSTSEYCTPEVSINQGSIHLHPASNLQSSAPSASDDAQWVGTPFANPFPYLIDDYILTNSEESYNELGYRKRFSRVAGPSTPNPNFDLTNESQISPNTQSLLRTHLDLNGRRDRAISTIFLQCLQREMRDIKTGEDWASFRADIFPNIRGAAIRRAVSLGLGGLLSLENERELWKWVTELACFLCLVEGILQDSPFSSLDVDDIARINEIIEAGSENSGTGMVRLPQGFEVVLQDPLFTSADARLFAALGIRAVKAPHDQQYITHCTLLFALHLPYDTIWNHAFASDEPTVYIGDIVDVTSAKCMGDALVEARKERNLVAMEEVRTVHRNAEAFLLGHDMELILVPQVSKAYDLLTGNIVLYHPKPFPTD